MASSRALLFSTSDADHHHAFRVPVSSLERLAHLKVHFAAAELVSLNILDTSPLLDIGYAFMTYVVIFMVVLRISRTT